MPERCPNHRVHSAVKILAFELGGPLDFEVFFRRNFYLHRSTTLPEFPVRIGSKPFSKSW